MEVSMASTDDFMSPIRQALTDPTFAENLRSQAQSIWDLGEQSPHFDQFMTLFKVTPEQIARMRTVAGGNRGLSPLTGLTITTAPCGTTTTTTTTTNP